MSEQASLSVLVNTLFTITSKVGDRIQTATVLGETHDYTWYYLSSTSVRRALQLQTTLSAVSHELLLTHGHRRLSNGSS